MALQDLLLITQDDIRIYRPTATLNDKSIEPFIREAQRHDLKPVLGDALYRDMLENLTTEKYSDLLNGKSYLHNAQSVYYEGIKPMLAYYSLARYIKSAPVKANRMGVVKKISEQSEPSSVAEINGEVNILRSNALDYQNGVILFLRNNPTVYPLYGGNNGARITSFNFFKG